MTLLATRPQSDSFEAEALIKEARQLRRRRRGFAGGVVLTLLVVGALSYVFVGGSSSKPPLGVSPVPSHLAPPLNAAADSSGTYQVQKTTAINGVIQSITNQVVKFSGQNAEVNLNETGKFANEFTTDERLVNGVGYTYSRGRNAKLQWILIPGDIGTVYNPAVMSRLISPKARFRVEGRAKINGESVSRLVARDPAAIDPGWGPLGGDPTAIEASTLRSLMIPDGTLTSFELWTDANNVVLQVAATSTNKGSACEPKPPFNSTAEIKELEANHVPLRNVPQSCGTQARTMTSSVKFDNLGVPQSITAPPNFQLPNGAQVTKG